MLLKLWLYNFEIWLIVIQRVNKPNQLLLECKGQITKILSDWGEKRVKVHGGEKEQRSQILPKALTPQLDTEPTAFRLRHRSHQDR